MTDDNNDVEKFINWWFDIVNRELGHKNSYLELRILKTGENKPKQYFFQTPESALQFCNKLHEDKFEGNVWYGLQPRKTTRGKTENVEALLFYGLDFDALNKDPKEGCPEDDYKDIKRWGTYEVFYLVEESEPSKKPPYALIATGNGLQAIFAHTPQMPTPPTNKEHAKKTMELGRKVLESQPHPNLALDEVKDVARVLRLPDFVNPKGKRTSELIYIEGKAQTKQNIEFDVLKTSRTLESALALKIGKTGRYGYFTRLLGLMASHDMPFEEAKALLEKFNQENCEEPAPQLYIDNALTSYGAWKKENKKFVETEIVEDGNLLQKFVKKTEIVETNDGNQFEDALEEVLYYDNKIIISKHRYKDKAKREERETVLNAQFRIKSRIQYAEQEDDDFLWKVEINKNDFSGRYDDIVKELEKRGLLTGSRDLFKQIFSIMLSFCDYKTEIIFPTVGIYITDDKATLALDSTTVSPILDSQKTFLKSREFCIKDCGDDTEKEVCQATANFITSMPIENVNQTLMTRGFAVLAPMAYEFKKSILQIFPYLYLYGEKGSSKTQMAIYSATKMYGELQPLNSESVESAFRLAMEFAGAKMPRVVDEAKQVFEKNEAIFKSASTSTLATKRGSKDKTMDSYPAFCTFILTSNEYPIQSEDDAKGAIQDRLIILNCKKGKTFQEDLYKQSVSIMLDSGIIFGNLTLEWLKNKINECGFDWFLQRTQHYSKIIDKKNESVGLRRCYCLAQVLLGIEIYYDILKKYGIEIPIKFESDEKMVDKLFGEMIKEDEEREQEFLVNFMEFVQTTFQKIKEIENMPVEKKPVINLKNQGILITSNEDIIITANALRTYKKQYNIKNISVKNIPILIEELKQFGMVVEYKTHYSMGGIYVKGIVLTEANMQSIINFTKIPQIKQEDLSPAS